MSRSFVSGSSTELNLVKLLAKEGAHPLLRKGEPYVFSIPFSRNSKGINPD